LFAQKTSEFSVDPKSEVLLIIRRFIEVHGKGKINPVRSQINKVLKRLAYDIPPTPLAVVLAARLLMGQIKLSTSLIVEKTDSALISQSFKLLENQFGKRLTVLAFSFITFSVNGLTDIEILDLLSLDNEFNASVYEYRSCSKHRVSTHLWQRLKKEVGVLLKENKEGRLHWVHRRVRTYAKHKYSEQKFTKKYIHQLMGQYFANIVEKRIQEERAIALQPITLTDIPVWFHNTSINKRRFEEGLHHLIEANLLTEACKEVCNIDNICAYFKCGLKTELVTNIVKLHRAIVQTGESKRTIFSFSESFFNKVDCYMRWIRQLNCEIMRCTPECGIFTTFSASQPLYSDVFKDAFELHDAEYVASSSASSAMKKKNYFTNWPTISTELTQFDRHTWNRGVCFGENIQFQSLISTFYHDLPVKCIDWLQSKNDTKLVSVMKREMQIWDTITEQVIDSFTLPADIYCAAVNNDSTRLACGAKDRLIRIFDLATGMVWLALNGHVGFVTSLCFSNCNTLLCSGSTDCAINIWNLVGGSIVKSFEGHSFEVTQVMFSPDDKRIVSG
jgi:hypothetical protein